MRELRHPGLGPRPFRAHSTPDGTFGELRPEPLTGSRVGGWGESNPGERTSKISGREASEAVKQQKWKEKPDLKQEPADPAGEDPQKLTEADRLSEFYSWGRH